MAGEVLYLARRKLKITNAAGAVPSTTRIAAGQRFELDGDERVDISRLLASGAIELYVEEPTQDQYIEEQRQERAADAARPRLRRDTRG